MICTTEQSKITKNKQGQGELGMVNFLEFCEGCSGIDGGDATSKYWFVGMEWADWGDEGIAKYYQNGECEKLKKPEYTSIDIEEKDKNGEDIWKFEKKLNKLYQQIAKPKNGSKIFSSGSDSFKLNLFPLPFRGDDDERKKGTWNGNEPYRELTGFSSFKSYQKGVIKARQKCFDNLLKLTDRPKTIFCFGIGYKNFFAEAFNIPEDWFTLVGRTSRNYRIFAVYNPSPLIKQIIICPFPYFEYSDEDVEKIIKCVI